MCNIIDGETILRSQLARSLGLDLYKSIITGDPAAPSFQRSFNRYYRIRRNEEWRNFYYALFLKAKKECYDYNQIITELYKQTGNVEASFSSKMFATINVDKPIWDQYVLKSLGLELTGKTPDEKLHNAVQLYSEIENWYLMYLSTIDAQENIKLFDTLLPDYKWISNVKKIDCLLWSKREAYLT